MCLRWISKKKKYFPSPFFLFWFRCKWRPTWLKYFFSFFLSFLPKCELWWLLNLSPVNLLRIFSPHFLGSFLLTVGPFTTFNDTHVEAFQQQKRSPFIEKKQNKKTANSHHHHHDPIDDGRLIERRPEQESKIQNQVYRIVPRVYFWICRHLRNVVWPEKITTKRNEKDNYWLEKRCKYKYILSLSFHLRVFLLFFVVIQEKRSATL